MLRFGHNQGVFLPTYGQAGILPGPDCRPILLQSLRQMRPQIEPTPIWLNEYCDQTPRHCTCPSN